MERHLLMSLKELRRKGICEDVLAGRLTLREGSRQLVLSYRQMLRVYERFESEGVKGLVHRNRGRPSNRRKAEALRTKALARYEERYADYGLGPTLAAEKLAEEGLVLDHETLRRWLLSGGLWKKRRKRRAHRSRRERKAHFGELVQMDGSHHEWFGSQKPRSCLMNMVDDATGTTEGLLAEQETTEAAMQLLWRWIEKYGVPVALYTDKKSVFVTDREPTLEEQLADEAPLTAFGKACKKLGISIITANSPQAKGRVERKHAVFQDRFVKELALRRITTLAAANKLLNNGFIQSLNEKFAVAPLEPKSYHRPLGPGVELADIFCFETVRKLHNDWTIRHGQRYYQITDDNRPLPRPKDKILIRVRLDGTVALLYRDKELHFECLTPKKLQARHEQSQKKTEPFIRPKKKPETKWRPNCRRQMANIGRR